MYTINYYSIRGRPRGGPCMVNTYIIIIGGITMPHLKYTLEIRRDGEEIRTAAEPVRMREIPHELSRLVRSGLHDWTIDLYHAKTDTLAVTIWGSQEMGFTVQVFRVNEPIPDYLLDAIGYTCDYLNSDALYYRNRVTLEKLFTLCRDNDKWPGLFAHRSSGSERGYTRVRDGDVLRVERLNYGTVIKVRSHWTRNYSYVDTWEVTNPSKVLTICHNLEDYGWNYVKETI